MDDYRIYLSKSNRANPDYVMVVREYLNELGYKVIEHEGGAYNEDFLYTCKKMVMVGMHSPTHMNKGEVLIGKGQYHQLNGRRNRGMVQNYYFSHEEEGNPIFRKIAEIRVMNEDNWVSEYGLFKINMHTIVRLRSPLRPIALTRDDGIERMEVERERKPKRRPKPEHDSEHLGAGNMFTTHLACITLFNKT